MKQSSSVSALADGSDELGVYAQVSIDPEVFLDTSVFKAAYWYTDSYYVHFSRDATSRRLLVEFRAKSGEDAGALKRACAEFANKVLDFEVRQRVLLETSAIRDTLVKKAFFEARAALPALSASNESLLPTPGARAI
jgi:His-Xaa-Ser system protein HxsD